MTEAAAAKGENCIDKTTTATNGDEEPQRQQREKQQPADEKPANASTTPAVPTQRVEDAVDPKSPGEIANSHWAKK